MHYTARDVNHNALRTSKKREQNKISNVSRDYRLLFSKLITTIMLNAFPGNAN